MNSTYAAILQVWVRVTIVPNTQYEAKRENSHRITESSSSFSNHAPKFSFSFCNFFSEVKNSQSQKLCSQYDYHGS